MSYYSANNPMQPKKFLSLFNESFLVLIKNPLIFIPAFVFWLVLFIVSKISVLINKSLSNSITLTVWLILFFIISLAIMSFFFSGIIALASKKQNSRIFFKHRAFVFAQSPHFSSWVSKHKPQESVILDGHKICEKQKQILMSRVLKNPNTPQTSVRGFLTEFFLSAKKFWKTNLLNLILISLITIAIERIAHYSAFFIGIFFKLSLQSAQLLFILIYFAGLIGILIFLAFSVFLAVTKNLEFRASIRASIYFVKKEYLSTLTLSVILFVFFFLFNRFLSGIYADLIENIILMPFLAVLITKFILSIEK